MIAADELPPTGDWPGGRRYDLEVTEDVQAREWSDEDKARAYDRGERLPVLWRFKRELWRDVAGTAYGRWWWVEPVR